MLRISTSLQRRPLLCTLSSSSRSLSTASTSSPDPLLVYKERNARIILSRSKLNGFKPFLRMVLAEGHEYNDVNWSTAFSSLVKFNPRQHVILSDLTDEVVDMFDKKLAAEGSMAEIGAREAANIVRSLSLIKRAPPNLVSMVSEVSFAERLVREDGPKGISQVLHGLSETRQGAPALVKLMDRDEVVEKFERDPKVGEIAKTVAALAGFKAECPKLVGLLGKEAVVERLSQSRDQRSINAVLVGVHKLQQCFDHGGSSSNRSSHPVPSNLTSALDDVARVESLSYRVPSPVMAQQFRALSRLGSASPNMAREILRNAEMHSRLHPNLLSSTMRAYSQENYRCDELVKFVDERCKRDPDEMARRGSSTFLSSMLHMTSRLGCFWASNFYSAFTAQSTRISEQGREGDTRSCTKALVGLALAGRIGENEEAAREMWEAMMYRAQDLTQGNLRELYHTQLLAGVEGVQLDFTDEVQTNVDNFNLKNRDHAANHSTQFPPRSAAQQVLEGLARAMIDADCDLPINRHPLVDSGDGGVLTTFNLALPHADRPVGIDVPVEGSFLLDLEKGTRSLDGRCLAKARLAESKGWTLITPTFEEARVFMRRCRGEVSEEDEAKTQAFLERIRSIT